MSEIEVVCVPAICKGFCCTNISPEVAKNLKRLGLTMIWNGKDYTCSKHDPETGLCTDYKNRTWFCKSFFCPSASRGFMARARDSMKQEHVDRLAKKIEGVKK